ncbi:MAG: 3-deoxy-7-phosphoheptulonate synthase, partial [Planctomycetes bacterium]|nr:3-deoxy-7-phosphoheptulonate synthase [Planctomycetota bacterium]
KIGEAKSEHGDTPVQDAERERGVVDAWRREAEALGLSPYFVSRILREVLHYSHRGQEKFRRDGEAPSAARVGFQGVSGAYSESAVEKLFTTRGDTGARPQGYPTFSACVHALERGELDYVLLPVENSICGSVQEVVQLLTSRKLVVVDEEVCTIDHCLAGSKGSSLAAIRTVRSHPIALLQCQRALDELDAVETETWFDTSAAAESVASKDDPSVAAICSSEAAERAGLEILKRDLADHDSNQTRFLLLATKPDTVEINGQPMKTSLVFEAQHRHGALLECLQVFEDHDVNLTRLESRPVPDKPWEYMFLVDFEGHPDEPEVGRALNELQRVTGHVRVLGSYPNRSTAPVPPPRPRPARSATTKSTTPPRTIVDPKLPLSSHGEKHRTSVVSVKDVRIGADTFTLISGPCAIENEAQVRAAATMVHKHGAAILRGGAFKPRSSPYSFQGLGLPGLDMLVEAGKTHGMPVVTEVLRIEDLAGIVERADMLQVGARNMQNFALLRAIGQTKLPVLLKRGMSATIEELLQAAEYVMAGGNHRVVLCERGIRTFETATRATLDVSAIPVLKQRTHLPVIVDPSHAAGVRDLVVPLALASAAAGADGIIVEAHPNPAEALCDKDQALTDELLGELVRGLDPIVTAAGRTWS